MCRPRDVKSADLKQNSGGNSPVCTTWSEGISWIFVNSNIVLAFVTSCLIGLKDVPASRSRDHPAGLESAPRTDGRPLKNGARSKGTKDTVHCQWVHTVHGYIILALLFVD